MTKKNKKNHETEGEIRVVNEIIHFVFNAAQNG